MHSVPIELEEAAAIDNCKLPSHDVQNRDALKPVLVTIGIIQFFACWNEFSFALILLATTV